MSKVGTTKMSSRGQVVIPEEVRKQLGLTKDSRFAVFAEGDVVILKVIKAPSMAEFDSLIARAEEAAKRAGLIPEDVDRVIREVREDR